jgi:D-alanyl-D-alanine carboxypeptidase
MRQKRTQRLLCGIILASLFTCQASAVSTSAASAVLIEQESGRVLYQQEPDSERLIASITKIMTAVVALEHGNLRDAYTVTAEDMAEGSSMYLKPGETVELEELLYGLMLVSGNDAALAVAHCVSGSTEDFVALMNDTAQRLGMTHSSFQNPNGLDAQGHYSSAGDMAILAAYALKNQDFRRIVSTTSITIGTRTLTNHNKLLRLCEGCIGVKTGYTKAAGRTLVSAAEREGMTLICVTLSDGDDWNDHMSLLDYGFANYRMETAAGAGQALTNISVKNGTVKSIPLSVSQDLRYPVTGEEKLTLLVEAPLSVSAPVAEGDVLGTVWVCLDGEKVAQADLVAAEASALESETETTAPSIWERLFG